MTGKPSRRTFLEIAAGLGAGAAFLASTKPSPKTIFAQSEPVQPSLPALEDVLREFEALNLSQEQMSTRLLNSDMISADPARIAEVKARQQRWLDADPAWTPRVAALGDSVAGSIGLGLFKPEIKADPLRVNLGAYEGELRSVLEKYDLITDPETGSPLGVVSGLPPTGFFDPMMCTGGCEPGENLLSALIRQKPAVVFVCLGRVSAGTLETFAALLHDICTQFLQNAILPVLVNPPVVLWQNGETYPDEATLQGIYRSPDWAEEYRSLLANDVGHFLKISYWYSYYAQAMGFPDLCAFPMLKALPDFGFEADNMFMHFSYVQLADESRLLQPNISPVEKERNLSKNAADWTGLEVITLIVLRFMALFDGIDAV